MKILFFLAIFNSCFLVNAGECEKEKLLSEYKPSYAKLFTVKYFEGYKLVTSAEDRFIVADQVRLNCQSKLPVFSSTTKRFVATSTTHLPVLSLFSLEETLVGFQGRQYIYNEKIKQQKIKDIHYQLNAEELLSLKPDLVMAYPGNLVSSQKIHQLRKLKIPIVLNHDFEELHPVARAEWMVFSALFFGKDKEAIEYFTKVKKSYEEIKAQASLVSEKKKVLVGDIQNGKWVTCGGKSDLAIMISDAGGELFLKTSNAETQSVSLEKIFSLETMPQVWLGQNNWQSIKAMKQDSRYRAFFKIPLFNNNNLLNKDGFNDYWETGMSRPDLLLKDLFLIFHPEKKSNPKLVWYRKLND